MDIYYLHSMIDTTRSFLRSHRDLATRFIKAYVEGIAYFKKNRPESVEVMKKKLRTAPAQTKYLERSHALYASGYFENAPYPSVKGASSVLEFLSRDNPGPEPPIQIGHRREHCQGTGRYRLYQEALRIGDDNGHVS
jgi:hypothetical protein